MEPDLDSIKAYWNKQPCNIKHSNKKIGTKGFFEDCEKKKAFVEPDTIPFAQYEKYKGKNVLEVGVGIGTEMMRFLNHEPSHYKGIDLSEESINIARQRLKVYEKDQEMISCENAETFCPEKYKSYFDLVYSFGVIHHSPNPLTILKNAYKMLKPGGELKIMIYHKNSVKGLFLKDEHVTVEAQKGCPLAYTYSKEEAMDLVHSASFEIEDIQIKHIFAYHIEEYKKGNYVKDKYFKHWPESVFQELSNLMGWHLLITARKPKE